MNADERWTCCRGGWVIEAGGAIVWVGRRTDGFWDSEIYRGLDVLRRRGDRDCGRALAGLASDVLRRWSDQACSESIRMLPLPLPNGRARDDR